MTRITLAIAAVLSLISSISHAQSCVYAEVYQDFSYEDTFNSSGTPLGEAYAVFQQDRFYVNQQRRLDPYDKPDPVMVNREARAIYGQAVRAYMNANEMGDMSAQVLVGSQYTVELEACGNQSNPSIQILSMRMDGDIEDDSWELELEYREAELADWEQRLNQREADFNIWEQQLIEWERRLSDMQYNFEQLTLDAKPQSSANNAGFSLISGVPETMLAQAGGSCNGLRSQAISQSTDYGITIYSNDAGRWTASTFGTDACRADSSDTLICTDFEATATIVEASSEPLVLQMQARDCTTINEFTMTNGAGQLISRHTEALCPRLFRFMPEAKTKVIECR